METTYSIGINRRIRIGRRNKIEHRSIVVSLPFSVGTNELHEAVKEYVKINCVGWLLTGYAPEELGIDFPLLEAKFQDNKE